MKILRLQAVIPTLVLLLSVWLLAILLVDPLAKRLLIRLGENAAGAKVEIQSVRVGFRDTSLTIRGVAIADRQAPMQNLVEWDSAVFDAMALPLLEKRVVIENASLTGLRFGTPRKTSGALWRAPEKPGVVTKAAERLWSHVETLSLDKWGDIQKYADVKSGIHPESLKVTAAAKAAQAKLAEAPSRLQNQFRPADYQARAEALKARASTLSQGGSDPQSIVQKLAEAKTLQADVLAFQKDIETAQQTAKAEIAQLQNSVDDVKRAKEADWSDLRKTFSLPALDSQSLLAAVLGPTVARNTEKLISWSHTVKAYMPAKAQTPPPPPRGKGRTIEFPKLHDWPRFVLMRCELSGTVGQQQPLAFRGQLTGLTTNPSLYGKPMTVALTGQEGVRRLAVNGLFDFTQEISRQHLSALYSGFQLPTYSLGQPNSFAIQIEKGLGAFESDFTLINDDLKGTARFRGDQLRWHPEFSQSVEASSIGKGLAASLTSALAKTSTLQVATQFSGTLSHPDFQIASNLGDVMKNAITGVVGAQVAEQEKALRTALDHVADEKIRELTTQLSGFQQQLLGPLNSQTSVANQLLTQVKNEVAKSTGMGDVQKKATDALKGIFGR